MQIAHQIEEDNIFDNVTIVNWKPGCHLNADGTVKPGIYRGMPNHIYHGCDGDSSTIIKSLATTTPLHTHKTVRSDKSRKLSSQQKKTFEVGTLYHELTLETKAFYERYVALPKVSDFKQYTIDDLKVLLKERKLPLAGTKGVLKSRINEYLESRWKLEENDELPEGETPDPIRRPIFEYDDAVVEIINDVCDAKAVEMAKERLKLNVRSSLLSMLKEEDIAIHSKVIPIEWETWQDVHEMYRTTMADPLSRALLFDGEAELSVFAVCPKTGLLLKCRFDFLNRYGEAVDLKSARSVNPAIFKRHCRDLRYDVQEAFYIYTGRLAGLNVKTFIFTACEKGDAVVCINFEFGKATKHKGNNDMNMQLQILRECVETNKWPAYLKTPRIVTLELY